MTSEHEPPADAQRTDAHRTAQFWNRAHAEDWDADSLLAHPVVQGYVSLRAFRSTVSHMEVVIQEIRRRTAPGARLLSVGCGAANKERVICTALPDRTLVGLDIATDALAQTRDELAQQGLHNLELQQGDFNALELEPGSFDMILGLGAIHHVEQLETFWQQCHQALRPGGSILAQEYVGPSRFQWTDAQVEHGNRMLREVVPAEHLVHHREVKSVPLDELIAIDPSEAVRSAELVPTCKAAGFEFVDYGGCGCGLLQPVLINQAHTFDPANWEHNHILFGLFREEDRLMRAGVLGDCYASFVAEPR